MKLIIAGSRTISPSMEEFEYHFIEAVEDEIGKVTSIISGGANGVDKAGEVYAKKANLPIEQFIPDWDGLGKRAGHVRNKQMTEAGDCLLLIWDGKSKGSANMRDNMMKLGKPIIEFILHNCD